MTIIDVRSIEEFNGGNVVGSINIPLQEIENRIDDISSFKQPLYLCCASGGRSGIAAQYLKSNGIDCKNVGSWLQANALTKGSLND